MKDAIAPMERILSFYRVFLLRQNIFDSYPFSLCIHSPPWVIISKLFSQSNEREREREKEREGERERCRYH